MPKSGNFEQFSEFSGCPVKKVLLSAVILNMLNMLNVLGTIRAFFGRGGGKFQNIQHIQHDS